MCQVLIPWGTRPKTQYKSDELGLSIVSSAIFEIKFWIRFWLRCQSGPYQFLNLFGVYYTWTSIYSIRPILQFQSVSTAYTNFHVNLVEYFTLVMKIIWFEKFQKLNLQNVCRTQARKKRKNTQKMKTEILSVWTMNIKIYMLINHTFWTYWRTN